MLLNKNEKNKAEGKSYLLSYLVILTLFLILSEISLVVKCSGFYLGDFKLITGSLTIPPTIIPSVLYFLFAQLLVHALFVVIIWKMTSLACSTLRCSVSQTEKIGIFIFFLALITILLLNRIYFPNSKFSNVLLHWMSPQAAYYLLLGLSPLWCVLFLLSCYGLLISASRWWKITIASMALAGASGWFFLLIQQEVTLDGSTPVQPNVIIIGIDSLRPDFLGYFGSDLSTPHIDSFLNHATVFAESLAALARTYPSWVSILSGEYPKLNGARTNLADPSRLNLSETLPILLQQHGYKTFFATDETRFSNIDEHFGFDEVVTPPIGFNDFLIGSFNDFPLSNFLVNTVIGKYLFPYSYGNRAVFATYQPDSFLRLMQPMLHHSRNKPAFLVVHFCLPHYPYAWASLSLNKATVGHYQAAIRRVDKQFYDFMKLLKHYNWLEHSVVILLSDHGEAVERAGDRITDPELFIPSENNKKRIISRFYPPTSTNEKINQSGGHGTDVLGLSQYHTVFAVRSFGFKSNQELLIPGRVSLLDIKPTLLDLLHIPIARSDGDSLTNVIFGHESTAKQRGDFFTESDFSPEAIHSVHPDTRKVLLEGVNYFDIDPVTARIKVKNDMFKLIISSKQYADFYQSWVLALYPQVNQEMLPILVNLETGEWTNDLRTPFAKRSPADHMYLAMKSFYGDDIKHVINHE